MTEIMNYSSNIIMFKNHVTITHKHMNVQKPISNASKCLNFPL